MNCASLVPPIQPAAAFTTDSHPSSTARPIAAQQPSTGSNLSPTSAGRGHGGQSSAGCHPLDRGYGGHRGRITSTRGRGRRRGRPLRLPLHPPMWFVTNAVTLITKQIPVGLWMRLSALLKLLMPWLSLIPPTTTGILMRVLLTT